MSRVVFMLLVVVCLSIAGLGQTGEGSLVATGSDGKALGVCPLKSTAVSTEISGFMARVKVRQTFENQFSHPIEAVYLFPLSQTGAVDNMTMTVGGRVTRGKIMKRQDALAAYESAKSQGKTASLLEQERPNMFTQSVANIMPGEQIVIEISYVETLKYEDGAYEFVFPMTVGRRYIPAGVTDAARISPTQSVTRSGTDISIEINLNAGVPVEEIRSPTHEISQVNLNPASSKITLRGETAIPNKDFILRYDVTGKRIEDAVLSHRDARGGFFTLILQPPDKIASEDRTPKEIVFVLDTSGSMSGFPIEKAKEAMKLSLDGLYPEDTFNLITFAGDTHVLFERPVPATRANLDAAQAFLENRSGSGGTEMMKAIKAALAPSDSTEHLRIVCFMTDGHVGNEDEIIAEIGRHPKARIFSFGIGDSVNRYLLDKMAEAGKGEVEYVGLRDEGSKAARRFYERVRTPLLTDISIDWNGLPVADVYPTRVTDLFSSKPVIVHGRYTGAANGSIKLKGLVAGQPYERPIAVNLPASQQGNDVLATLWARTRVDQLSNQNLKVTDKRPIEEQITNLGLEFRLMTAFTSFVAVEDRVVNHNGTLTRVEVPTVRPAGTADAGAAIQTSVTTGAITALPKGIATQNLMVLSPASSAMQSTVEVSAESQRIDTTSSTVQTVITVDEFGSRLPPAKRRISAGKGKSAIGRGSGGGSGNGVGSGGYGAINSAIGAKLAKPVARTPEELRESRLGEKLHVWLYELASRGAENKSLSEIHLKFVRNGRAEIEIELTTSSPDVLEQLRLAGFDLVKQKGKTRLIGSAAIDKIAALTEVFQVRLILPRIA